MAYRDLLKLKPLREYIDIFYISIPDGLEPISWGENKILVATYGCQISSKPVS